MYGKVLREEREKLHGLVWPGLRNSKYSILISDVFCCPNCNAAVSRDDKYKLAADRAGVEHQT